MAEERVDARETNSTAFYAWTELFRTFQIALDPRKLLLAAGGIVTMALLWYMWATIFNGSWNEPKESDDVYSAQAIADKFPDLPKEQIPARQREEYLRDRARWELMFAMAGYRPADEKTGTTEFVGRLRTWPWAEDRGPNPYLLVTGQAGRPWDKGAFLDWFLTQQSPTLIEPLVKLFAPIIGLLDTRAGFWNRVYFLLIIFSTLATWAFFGGIITRLAAVQLAGKDRANLRDAVRFVCIRYSSYFWAPLVPLALVGFVVLLSMAYGTLFLIPFVGDLLIAGLGWPIVFLFGLIMAMLLIGLVGYPLMYSTISTEGSDTFDALSRTYNYVYQSPWSFIWYSLVAIAYGAVLVFFVVFMGSFITYLGKWAVNQTFFMQSLDREPDFLFIYAPESFHWRDLLLKDGPADPSKPEAVKAYLDTFYIYTTIAARMVGFWLTLFFLLTIGFSYSYFWTAGTMIYLLMRRKVDDTDTDEVYIEEEEPEEPFGPPPTTTPLPSVNTSPATPQVTMVEAPTLRTPAPAPAPTPEPAVEPPPPAPEPKIETPPPATAVPEPKIETPPPPAPEPEPAVEPKIEAPAASHKSEPVDEPPPIHRPSEDFNQPEPLASEPTDKPSATGSDTTTI